MARVILSKSERNTLNGYINFIIANPDPCDGCQDSGRCCGCPRESEYRKKIEESGVKKLLEINDVRLYVELSIEYAKVQKELMKAQEKVRKVSTELDTVKAKFIEEPKPDLHAISEDGISGSFVCALCGRKYYTLIKDCEAFLTKDCIGLRCKCPQCSNVNETTKFHSIKND